MQELHNSLMGRRLIEHDIPEIHQQLKRIADALEILIKRTEQPVKEKPAVATKFGPFLLTKVGAGQYKLQAYEDQWDIYRDEYSYTKTWRGDFVSGTPKDIKHFKMNTKKEVLNCIYQLYGPTTNSSGVSGADRSGDNR